MFVAVRVLDHLARVVKCFPADLAGVDSLCLVVVGVGLDVLFVAVLTVEAGIALTTVEHAHSIVDLYVGLYGWEEKSSIGDQV